AGDPGTGRLGGVAGKRRSGRVHAAGARRPAAVLAGVQGGQHAAPQRSRVAGGARHGGTGRWRPEPGL
ncbi:MAG: hypothetical protein AVDCRST_MAG08-1379, partial [uncultured Acetobacteraceae bacterium]